MLRKAEFGTVVCSTGGQRSMTASSKRVTDAFLALPPSHIVLSEDDRDFTRAQIGDCAGWIATELRTSPQLEYVFIASSRPSIVISAVLGCWLQGRCPIVLDNLPGDPWPGAEFEAQALLVVDAGFRPDLDLPELPSRPIVVFGNESAPLGGQVAGRLAYGVRTSGTTGAPRIALNTWAGLQNRLTWMVDELGSGRPPVIGLCTPLAFDSFFWQFTMPILLRGRAQCGATPYTRSLPDLRTHLSQGRLNWIDVTPSVMRMLLDDAELSAGGCAQVELVVLGGESTTSSLLEAVRTRFPAARILNLYGPSECAIGSVFADLTAHSGDAVPIGRPIPNTQAFLANPLVGGGGVTVEGELVLAGVCVGEGYLGAPEQTAARFTKTGGRVTYRTGDICRQDAEGDLYFIRRAGRDMADLADFKARGVRHDLRPWISGVAAALCVSDWTYRIQSVGQESEVLFDLHISDKSHAPGVGELLSALGANAPPHGVTGAVRLVVPSIGASGKQTSEQLVEFRFPLQGQTIKTADANDLSSWLETLFPQAEHIRSYRDAGGDSLDAYKLVLAAEELGIEVSFEDLLSDMPLSEVIVGALRRKSRDASH
ncbi:AMP-binding protein [Phenylobacterium kunshanense]|uniref:AMP-binding protein n=1 Tax=Phenylobacterium kunshanense TaxID=1445034 RepID=UPI0010579A8B|nr:AMP-binding protein [Phenylobacterium kunshanense]